ncbi:MAG: hypothetical protein JSS58_08105 [Proteobacteria bacterium]|nr:hypothetical protein [Pseudomonadota bacterium]
MFGKLFGPKQKEKKEPQLDPKTAALINAIRERSKEDPLVGAKLGSKEVFQRLLDGMKDSKGVHVESLLTALGALAGYACQANLRAQALTKGMSETAPFQVICTKDGKQYFYGDPLNNALAESQYSVWGLVGGAAQHAGAKDFPDLHEVFQYTTSVLGSEQFGIPRIPENHKPADTPVNYLKGLWPTLFPTVKLFCPNPVDWPILYSLAIQEAIYASKESIDPSLAFRIVMESAIPMSKVDLANS